MTKTLVDAGPLITLLDKSDRSHELCVEVFKGLREPLFTTWIPVTEAMYLLNFSVLAQNALLEMFERKLLEILTLELDDLPKIRRLMSRYADLPMDFADASLVLMAQKYNIERIFTLDRRDFAIYRLNKNKTFTILPELI